jgi:hypothetical protein
MKCGVIQVLRKIAEIAIVRLLQDDRDLVI